MTIDETDSGRRELLYLSSTDIALALGEIDPLLVVRRVLELHTTSRTRLPHEAAMRWHPAVGGAARSIAMSGGLLDDRPEFGTKVINANTRNPEVGLPRADGLLVLFDDETAAPWCVMEAARISSLRTAAVSALGVVQLAAAMPSKVAVVGAGELARRHVELLVERVPWVREVALHDVVGERAVSLARSLEGPVPVWPAGSQEEALAGAAVVVCTTTTERPYLTMDAVGPGTTVVNVSLDDVAEDLLLGCDVLAVDDWGLVEADHHRVLGRLVRSGAVAARSATTATLGECLAGASVGRTRSEDVVVINPFGMAIVDVAFGHAIARVTRQRGLGTRLER